MADDTIFWEIVPNRVFTCVYTTFMPARTYTVSDAVYNGNTDDGATFISCCASATQRTGLPG